MGRVRARNHSPLRPSDCEDVRAKDLVIAFRAAISVKMTRLSAHSEGREPGLRKSCLEFNAMREISFFLK
ncbi:hypothetical protein, partial [Rhizobium grahamii]|uniref:hypothetical protein n=1 Tax=Rhizobium grahamii TaxID=1120045 RepID=UPI0019D7176D